MSCDYFWKVSLDSADYFCLVSCISNEGHLSVFTYTVWPVIALKSLLVVLYCRKTALDKYLNSQLISCIRWAKAPNVTFKGHADNKRVRRRSMGGL